MGPRQNLDVLFGLIQTQALTKFVVPCAKPIV